MGRWPPLLLALTVSLLGCGGEETTQTPPPPTPPEACRAGTRPLTDGSCLPAGISECSSGFVATDDDSCEPQLPVTPCADGMMASPGETACRELAPCGDPPWGNIPVDGATVYVDRSYMGTSSGSASEPWTSIGEAIAVASPGALIAIAAGSYAESLTITSPVRLWGRCPAQVTIDGGASEGVVVDETQGVELHDLSVRGGAAAVVVQGGGLAMDRVRLHDSGEAGLRLFDGSGPSQVSMSASLIERPTRYGIWMAGSELTLDRSVVRGLRLGSFPFGQAIAVQPSLAGVRSTLTMTATVLEENEDVGLAVFGSDAEVGDSVVRTTLARVVDGRHGRGVVMQDAPMSGRATVALHHSVVAASQEVGVFIAGSDVQLDQVVVRDTLAGVASGEGRGVDIEPSSPDGRPVVAMAHCSIERSVGAGLLLLGAEGNFESVAVVDTAARLDGLFGHGIVTQDSFEHGGAASAQLAWCRISRASEVGIIASSSSVELLNTLVEDIVPSAAELGDGIVVVRQNGDAAVAVEGCEVSRAARAGLASFGALASVTGTRLQCTAIDIVADAVGGTPATFDDGGDNVCGCGDEVHACQALSPNLTPPSPLPGAGE